nr:TMV resistance protein N-like [Malus domestica]
MVGIWGPVGIGKTTIAKAVYNSVAQRFEGSCFLANVREISMSPGGLVRLQNLLISDLLRLRVDGSESLKVPNIDLGISMIKARLGHKKILLILDDVNDLSQRLLTAHGIHPIYKVKNLDPVQALELFSCHAFNNSIDRMPDDCMQTAITASSYAQGLPLALVVFGAFMRHRSTDEWKAPLDRRFFNREIHDILKISLDALEESEKNVFLDIAFFLKGEDKDSLIKIIEGYHYSPQLTIGVLLDNALIEIEENRVWMTEVLEDMGKEIVR